MRTKLFALLATALMILVTVAMSGCIETGTFITEDTKGVGLYISVPICIKVSGSNFISGKETGDSFTTLGKSYKVLITQTDYKIETAICNSLRTDSSGNANAVALDSSTYQSLVTDHSGDTIYSYNSVAVNTDKSNADKSTDTREISGTQMTFDTESLSEAAGSVGLTPDSYASSIIGGDTLKGVASVSSPNQQKWTAGDMVQYVTAQKILLPAWIGVHVVINSRLGGSLWSGDFKVPYVVGAPGPGKKFDPVEYKWIIYVFTPFAKYRKTSNVQVGVFGMVANITVGYTHLQASPGFIAEVATWLGIGLVIAGALLISAAILCMYFSGGTVTPVALAALKYGMFAVGAGLCILWMAKLWDENQPVEKAKWPFWHPSTPEKNDGSTWVYKIH